MIDLSVGISGRYIIDVTDAQTGEVKQHLEFDNLLTNGLMDGIGNGTFNLTTAFNGIQVGSGSLTPQFTDTALQAPIGSISTTQGSAAVVSANTTPEYGFRRINRVFTESQANGELREVGVFSAGGVLTSRALLRDSAGNITTITKTPSDFLTIQYEYRLHAPQDVTGSFFVNSGSCDYTIRPAGVNASTGWLTYLINMGGWTQAVARMHEANTLVNRQLENNPSPQVDSTNASFLLTVQPYSNGTYYRDILLEVNPNAGNFTTGIGLMTLHPWTTTVGTTDIYGWQMNFVPSIDKTIERKFTLRVRVSWARR